MNDLRRLHVLRAVAHYGTVTAAAHALHFTRVRCTSEPHRKLLTCTRAGGAERPAVAVALRELREVAPSAVA